MASKKYTNHNISDSLKNMVADLSGRLEAPSEKFKLHVSELEGVGNIPMLTLDDKIILLVNKNYTEKEYLSVLAEADRSNLEHVSVFYGDGKNYFRSASFGRKAGLKSAKKKQTDHRSLRNYTDEQMSRLMLLTPPELIDFKKMVQ